MLCYINRYVIDRRNVATLRKYYKIFLEFGRVNSSKYKKLLNSEASALTLFQLQLKYVKYLIHNHTLFLPLVIISILYIL